MEELSSQTEDSEPIQKLRNKMKLVTLLGLEEKWVLPELRREGDLIGTKNKLRNAWRKLRP